MHSRIIFIKFKGRTSIKPFNKKMWTWYRSKQWQIKVAQAKAAQKLPTTHKKSASDNNRLTIFGCCIWRNTKDEALLIALMNILFQIGWRVSEESTVGKIHLKAEVSYYCEINTIIIFFWNTIIIIFEIPSSLFMKCHHYIFVNIIITFY